MTEREFKRNPKREEFDSSVAWIRALRQSVQANLLEFKECFDDYRDWFISLEHPTIEQAQEYKKNEHQYATAAGMNNSLLRNLENYLKKFDPESQEKK